MIKKIFNNFSHNINTLFNIIKKDKILQFVILLIFLVYISGIRLIQVGSHSDKDGYYLVNTKFFNKNLNKGDYAGFCLNNEIALNYAISYGLNTKSGICNKNSAPLLKHVCAVSGDKIKLIDNYIYINNNKTFMSFIKRKDVYSAIDWSNEITVPKDCYFMCGSSSLSFDSRYYGFICKNDLIARAYLIKEK